MPRGSTAHWNCHQYKKAAMQAYAAAASAGSRGNIVKPSRKEGIIRSKSLRRKLYSQVSDLNLSRWPISSGSGPQNRGGWCNPSTGFHFPAHPKIPRQDCARAARSEAHEEMRKRTLVYEKEAVKKGS